MALNYSSATQPRTPTKSTSRTRAYSTGDEQANWTCSGVGPVNVRPRTAGPGGGGGGGVLDNHHHLPQTSAVPVRPELAAEMAELLDTLPLLHCQIDFAKPDGLRNRAIVVENRRLYICEYYMSIWSPVFRAAFFSDVERDEKHALTIPNARYSHILELLECIYPQQRVITEYNIHRVLPLAHEYQCDELLRRCIDFLKNAPMKQMDKIVLADRFHLDTLLLHCMQQIRASNQLDFYSNQYERLSDRTKVQLLEKLHQIKLEGGARLESIPETDTEDLATLAAARMTKFMQKSELHFSVMRSKSGKHYYCNPYYLAAWSKLLAEDVLSYNRMEFDCQLLGDEEASNFLLATHPPFIRLTDANVGSVLRAACKLEAPGLIRRCSYFLLTSSVLDAFEKVSLFDKCFLHELLEPSLRVAIMDLNDALRLSTFPAYEFLSSRAKAAILDKIATLLQTTTQEPGSDFRLSPHFCPKCRTRSPCYVVKWLCPQCGSYCGESAK